MFLLRAIARVYHFIMNMLTGTAHLLSPRRHLTMRFVYPLLLCLLTYNPTGYSYVHFIWKHSDVAYRYWPCAVPAGLLLIGAWLIFYNAVRAAFSSKILFGIVVGSFAILSYAPFFLHYAEPSPHAIMWAAYFVISATFWSGSVFPILKISFFNQVQVTGQIQTHQQHVADQQHGTNADDVDDSPLPTHHHH